VRKFRLFDRHVDELARRGLFSPAAGCLLKRHACGMTSVDEGPFVVDLNASGSIRLVSVPYGFDPAMPHGLAEVRLDCGPEVAREFIDTYLKDLDIQEVE
jgi:hypothetical protein